MLRLLALSGISVHRYLNERAGESKEGSTLAVPSGASGRICYVGVSSQRASSESPGSLVVCILGFLPRVKLLVRSSGAVFACIAFPDDRPTLLLEKLGNFIPGEGSSCDVRIYVSLACDT